MGTVIEESKLFNFAKKLKVLYVEDEEETRIIIMEIFKNIFGTVIEAKNGLDGIEKFDESIDLIITDINMPYMNGIDMLRTIKEKHTSVSSMITSAHSEISHFTDTIDIGIDGYLIKPIKTQILKTTIKRVIEKIFLKKELESYKKELEKKVKQQIDELNLKDEILMRQSRLAIMGELIDIVAHQWKQPLNVISARTQFLEFKTTDGENISIKDVDECSADVAYQVKHLVDTIDDFRRFLRPNFGTESCNLFNSFESLKVLLRDIIKNNSIDFRVECEKSLNIDVCESELKHIFINLVNNSKDAFIINKIKDRKIAIVVNKSDKDISIEFVDNAGGIDENILENIFDMNFTTKKEQGGTGIGLYMCKLIAEKYNFTIEAKNKDNGVCFKLEYKF